MPGRSEIYFELTPDELPAVRGWLDEHGIAASLRLCETADWYLFRKVAQARARRVAACSSTSIRGSTTSRSRQLVCKPCGGFYDLEAFENPP